MRAPGSVLLAVLAFLATAVVVAALMFVLVTVFAGPHSDLGTDLRVAVLVLAWLAVGVVPTLVALRVFRRGESVHGPR